MALMTMLDAAEAWHGEIVAVKRAMDENVDTDHVVDDHFCRRCQIDKSVSKIVEDALVYSLMLTMTMMMLTPEVECLVEALESLLFDRWDATPRMKLLK
jgi:hypothetical protein